MTKPKLHSCKIGTQPGLVAIKRGYKVTLNTRIEFCSHRDLPNRRWSSGIVTKINPDGYFFIELM